MSKLEHVFQKKLVLSGYDFTKSIKKFIFLFILRIGVQIQKGKFKKNSFS